MKKSASGAPVTRMNPSAPTPRCRLQMAAISPGSSDMRPSTSVTRTKSFPVPLYLPNRISSMCQILRHVVDHGRCAPLVRLEPSDPRVAAEPRHLPPGQLPGPLRDPRPRLLPADASRQVVDGFSVPDGLSR